MTVLAPLAVQAPLGQLISTCAESPPSACCRRTPEARAKLAARSCNAVLSRATLDLLEVALNSLRDAAAAYQQARAGVASAEAGALSAPQLANRGAIWNFQMPRLLT